MLIKFKAPMRNSCNKCGKIILQGDDTYANNMDEVLAGKSVCKACASPKKGKGKDEAEPEPEPVEEE